MKHTICLIMIVEEADAFYLQKTLSAIKPFIQNWLIAEKECTERTISHIESLLKDIPGEVVSVDTQINADIKNTLIAHSRDNCDYHLVLEPWMKADTTVETFTLSNEVDGYYIPIKYEYDYAQLRLLNANTNWQHIGLDDEFVIADKATNTSKLANFQFINSIHFEHRQIKSENVTELLSASVQANPSDSHSTFVLAKHLLYQNKHDEALEYFEQYINSKNHWDPEWLWYAYYYCAKIKEKLEYSEVEISDSYQQAYTSRPSRAEPLYDLARYHRTKNNFAVAFIYAKQAFLTKKPENDSYDISSWLYEWQIPTEYALIAQQLGYHDDVIKASNLALLNNKGKFNMRDSLIHSRQKSVDAIQKVVDPSIQSIQSNRIRLVIPFRNAYDYLKPCIDSILTQDYDNFTATFVDDQSTDDSASLIPTDDPRFELIQNTTRKGALLNRMDVIIESDPADIIIWLDGDDQLSCDDALSHINAIYNQTDCWLCYGQFLNQMGVIGNAMPYCSQQHLTNELESGEMRFPIHPITHRAGLFQRIQEFDPNYTCFKDDQNEWLFYASDAVLARPLFYLAGHARIYYCNKVLYNYSAAHVNSEYLANHWEQIETCRAITKRLRMPAVESYRPNRSITEQKSAAISKA